MMHLQNITLKMASIVDDACKFIQLELKNFDKTKIEFKGHESNMVSYVDKEAEKILVEGLSRILPEAGFITEEETVSQERKDLMWIIDPLDGTNNFMHKVPIYSCSVGLMKEGKMIAGVILDPNRDECFYAFKGGGAWCNDSRIQVSQPQTLSKCMIATGIPFYDFEKLDSYINILKKLMKNSHGLRRCGSAAIDMAWVAAGRFDGYFEYNINSYDIAAGCIILQEAGGNVTDFKGENNYIFGKNIIASCGGHIHKEFQEIIAKEWF